MQLVSMGHLKSNRSVQEYILKFELESFRLWGIFLSHWIIIVCDSQYEREMTAIGGFLFMLLLFQVGFAVTMGSDSSPRVHPYCSYSNQDPGVLPGTTAASS